MRTEKALQEGGDSIVPRNCLLVIEFLHLLGLATVRVCGQRMSTKVLVGHEDDQLS